MNLGDKVGDNQNCESMLHLMCELQKGRRSGEQEGYVSPDEVRAYFRGKRE